MTLNIDSMFSCMAISLDTFRALFSQNKLCLCVYMSLRTTPQNNIFLSYFFLRILVLVFLKASSSVKLSVDTFWYFFLNLAFLKKSEWVHISIEIKIVNKTKRYTLTCLVFKAMVTGIWAIFYYSPNGEMCQQGFLWKSIFVRFAGSEKVHNCSLTTSFLCGKYV